MIGLSMDEILRVPGRSSDEIAHHMAAGRPVIFTALTADWPARERWSLEYFRDRCADQNVLVARAQNGRILVSKQGIPQVQMRFGEFLDGLAQGRTEYYLTTPAKSMLPTLMEDVRYPEVYRRASFTDARLWVGPADFCTPLHHDWPENLFAQLLGSKRVLLVPRAQSHKVKSYGLLSGAPNFAQVDAESPDLQRFPEFAGTTRLCCTVGPGEVLYIPRLWWHQLRSNEVSASFNLWFARGFVALVAHASQSYARLRKLRGA